MAASAVVEETRLKKKQKNKVKGEESNKKSKKRNQESEMEGHESPILPKKKKNKATNYVAQFFKELKEHDEIRDNSEFGLKCMEIEATCGPSALLDMEDDDDKVHDDGNGNEDGDTSD